METKVVRQMSVERLTQLVRCEAYCVIIVAYDPVIAEASALVCRMADDVLKQAG